MTDIQNDSPKVRNSTNGPQCQYYVTRKKRLCRMTVRPGRQYCGEHEPQPQTADGQDDTRIRCPNDPKHTVYVSKLEKHLSICNARATEQPVYIVPNINAPAEVDTCLRKPLSQLPWDTVMQVVDKVNFLYEKHVKGTITTAPDYPIHSAVMPEFAEGDRAESSLRHLRQVSSLLWLTEQEGLVADDTCYVELGAGKGHMSYYACGAWRGRALLVDRASLRHKRDNKLAGGAARIRADLAHLALDRVPLAPACRALVGLAKHLCGVATDYALRCMTGAGAASTRGLVLATCCHHRCQRGAFVGNKHLEELGISGDEFNVMLGIVSWATCGDGRSRKARAGGGEARAGGGEGRLEAAARAGGGEGRLEAAARAGGGEGRLEAAARAGGGEGRLEAAARAGGGEGRLEAAARAGGGEGRLEAAARAGGGEGRLEAAARTRAGRRAKRLVDWARLQWVRERGFAARLVYFVPPHVSPENVAIVATRPLQT